ncbi:hypothetical protein [Paenibacillus donghaensis]|uniref:Uncharacterized protein n=1 Tax=Paenibacillus donghaensis TaxID=414771 RepID=A0A2Z2KE05_9BACL|nr:hypothetical protein [Paenibacillus donghaensis]ASA20239.1 hypothetical protein B9T62_05145 [Paenibacillus donghaensis]
MDTEAKQTQILQAARNWQRYRGSITDKVVNLMLDAGLSIYDARIVLDEAQGSLNIRSWGKEGELTKANFD